MLLNIVKAKWMRQSAFNVNYFNCLLDCKVKLFLHFVVYIQVYNAVSLTNVKNLFITCGKVFFFSINQQVLF